MTRWVIGDLLTGEITADLIVSSGSWADQLNSAATFEAKVLIDDYYDARTGKKSLNLREMTRPKQTFLAAIDQDSNRVHCAGPILQRPWDDPGRSVAIQATGLWAYWYWRVLIPALTAGQRPTDVTTVFTPAMGLSKGSVAKRIIEQSMRHIGGALPIDLPPESPGATEREYPGFDAAYIGDRLKQLVEVENGPDIAFQPYLADEKHIRWRMAVGTEADPYVYSSGIQTFDYSAPRSNATGLAIAENASTLASRAFELGGGQTDEALVGMATDPYLLDRGAPLLETVNSRSTVSILGTLDSYARERVGLGRISRETWTLKFKQQERPYLTSYYVGDFANLRIQDHPWIADGLYKTRIVGLQGDDKDTDVSVTFQEGVLQL